MNKAGGIIAMVAGVFAVIGAIVTLMVGGLGSAFKANDADIVVALGWGGIAFSFLVIMFGAVALFKPKGAGIGLIVCSLGGAILGGTIVAVFMVLSLIGGIVCVVGSKQKKGTANAIQSPEATGQSGEIYSQLERLADLKTKGVLTEDEFQSQKAKLLSGSSAVAASVPPLVAAMSERPSDPAVSHSLSGITAFGISLGIILPFCLVVLYNENLGKGLVGLVVLATSIWAAFDSSRVGLRAYKTALAAHPVILMIGMWLLWIITFPWYLVVRSKILAGILERRERPVRLGLTVIGAYAGVMAFLALGSAALYMSSGSSVKGIWTTTNSQLLAAANNAAPTQVAAGTSAPVASPAADGQTAEIMPFDSVDALLKNDGTAVGHLIRLTAKVAGVQDDEVDFERSEEAVNVAIVCHVSAEERGKFQAAKEGQELTVIAKDEGQIEIRPSSADQSGLYELKLTGCRLP